MAKKVEIYQIKLTANQRPVKYAFMDWQYARKNGFRKSDYEKVLEYEESDPDSDEGHCESIYYQSNRGDERFASFRSISTSDVIVINGRPYYVDDQGFKKVPEPMWKSTKSITVYHKDSDGLLKPSIVDCEVPLEVFASENCKPGEVIKSRNRKGNDIFFEVLDCRPGEPNLNRVEIPADCWIEDYIKTTDYIEPIKESKSTTKLDIDSDKLDIIKSVLKGLTVKVEGNFKLDITCTCIGLDLHAEYTDYKGSIEF